MIPKILIWDYGSNVSFLIAANNVVDTRIFFFFARNPWIYEEKITFLAHSAASSDMPRGNVDFSSTSAISYTSSEIAAGLAVGLICERGNGPERNL